MVRCGVSGQLGTFPDSHDSCDISGSHQCLSGDTEGKKFNEISHDFLTLLRGFEYHFDGDRYTDMGLLGGSVGNCGKYGCGQRHIDELVLSKEIASADYKNLSAHRKAYYTVSNCGKHPMPDTESSVLRFMDFLWRKGSGILTYLCRVAVEIWSVAGGTSNNAASEKGEIKVESRNPGFSSQYPLLG